MSGEERNHRKSAEIEASPEDRLREIVGLVRHLQPGDERGGNAGQATHARGGDGASDLLRELQALGETLASERKVREERLNSLAKAVIQLASLNFAVKASVSDRNDTLDGLASGLNMLREELQNSTVSKVYLDNVFASMADALVVASTDGTIRNVNQAALDLLGYRREELVGTPVGALMADGFSEADLVEVRGRELRCMTKSGAEVTVSLSTSVLREGGGRSDGFVCVLRDITERKRAEEERLRLLEELGAQAEVIRRMSTPLIPINDDLVVMPLVGAVDAERANQIVESLLHGIASRKPRMAIIDITAVALVDADVASTIIRAANAARLLGVRVILTGVRPEVARTLVELGFDLGAVIACGTLQSGIALSMKRETKPRRF